MTKKKSNDKNNNEKIIANNRRAKFDYEIIETYEAGICLTGSEVKSLRTSSVKLDDAHAQFTKNNELEIVNLHINEYKNNAKISVHKENRPRKLLLHRREINKIISKISKDGLSAIPLKLYFNQKGLVKLLLGIGRGKRNVDKRDSIKDREWKINKQRTFKNFNH